MRIALLLSWLLMACDSRQAVLVRFLSPRSIPAEADSLDVVVQSSSDGTELGRGSYALTNQTGFPVTLEIVRGDTTPTRISIDVYLKLGTDIVAAGTNTIDFVVDSRQQIDISMGDVPTLRAVSSNTSVGAPSLAIERPADVDSGDVLVAMMAHDSGTSFFVPAPLGWSYVSTLSANSNFGVRTYVFWRIAGMGEPATYSFTPEPAYPHHMAGGIWAFVAADPVSPIAAAVAEAHDAPTTTCTAPSLETASTGLLVYACAKVNATTQFAPPADMVEDWDRSSSASDSAAMSVEGAHGFALRAGASGSKSSSSTADAGGEVALLFAVVAPQARRVVVDDQRAANPCFLINL